MAEPTVNLDNLSPAQQEALQQYTAVTNQDIQAAIPILQRCQWNVQVAITQFLDGAPPEPAPEAAAAPPPQDVRRQEVLLNEISRGRASRQTRLEPAPRVVPQPESQINHRTPLLLYLFIFPFNLVSGAFGRLGRFLTYLFPFLPRLWTTVASRNNVRGPSSVTGGRRQLSARDTAARTIREFEEEYGSHTLPFLETGYTQAYDQAKREFKYLLVILISPEHDDTSSFVRDTLLSPNVTSYLTSSSSNIILWLGNVLDSEPYQISASLRITKLPFAGLMAFIPSVSSNELSQISRITGPTAPSTFVSKLRTAIAQNSDAIDRARAQRAEQEASQSIREQQNTAYERSLAQDRARAQKKRQEEARRQEEEKEAAKKIAEEKQYAATLATWRLWRAQRLQPEPGADVKDAVRINIRLPSGERVMRKFEPSLPLEEVYAFVECHDVLSTDDIAGEKVEKPADFEFEYGFLLVSPMPREEYDLEKGGTIRERIGRSGSLIVETVGDGESEDDNDNEEQD